MPHRPPHPGTINQSDRSGFKYRINRREVRVVSQSTAAIPKTNILPSCEQQAPRWRPTKWRPAKWRRAGRRLPFGELPHLPFGELLCEQSAQIKVNSDAYSITAQALTGPLLFPEPRMRTTRPASDQRPTERRQRRNSHRLAGEAGGENICRQPPPQPLRQRRFRAGGGR